MAANARGWITCRERRCNQAIGRASRNVEAEGAWRSAVDTAEARRA